MLESQAIPPVNRYFSAYAAKPGALGCEPLKAAGPGGLSLASIYAAECLVTRRKPKHYTLVLEICGSI